jgi:hypothetical protein
MNARGANGAEGSDIERCVTDCQWWAMCQRETVHEGTLVNWVGKERQASGEGRGALSEDERAELVRLRRENAELLGDAFTAA